jgi:o-succinylbenzoate---CoA ligase
MLILTPSNTYNQSTTDVYEQKAIDFCQSWLSGRDEFLLHTSGSTGTPKPILLGRSQVLASAEMTIKTFQLASGDTFLVNLNVEFIAGVMMLVRGMVAGANLVIVEPSANPIKNLDEFSFDFGAFVPYQLQKILEESPEKIAILNNMKAIIVGGSAVNVALEKQIQVIKSPVYSTYGMTETVSHIAIKRLNGDKKEDFFQKLPNIELGINTNNCLNIKGLVTNNDLIQTNDLVEFINQNQFKLLGRIDNVINSGGVKIQLEKVEKIIEAYFENEKINSRFWTAGVQDENLGQKLVLFIESLVEIDFSKLKNWLSHSLTKYEIPKEIFYQNPFLETPTGKIDKKSILKSLNL